MDKTTKKTVKLASELKPRITPTQARAAETRNNILQTALNIIDEQGIGALTTRRIAGELNVAIASVYRYFPNKEAILYSFMRRWYEEHEMFYKRFDEENSKEKNWRIFFEKLNEEFYKLPHLADSYRYGRVLASTWSIVEMESLEHKKEEVIIGAYVKFLKRFGSRWTPSSLKSAARIIRRTFDAAYLLSLSQPAAMGKQTIKLYDHMYYNFIQKIIEEDEPSS